MASMDDRPGPPLPRTISYSRVVDLSHVIHPDIPCWPGDPPVNIRAAAAVETEGYRLNAVSIGEHSGTHLNAPRSFFADGQGVDAYPAQSLVAPAVVIDVTGPAESNPDYTFGAGDLAAWEQRCGPVPRGSLVLLRTGWDQKWPDPRRFFGYDAQGCMHFPGFGLDSASTIMDHRAAAGLGTDGPGVDPAQDPAFAVNKLVLKQPRLVLENLNNLGDLPELGSTLVIGILRLRDGTGSPASVIALVP